MDLVDESIKELWSNTIKNLAYLFESIGADKKICDASRILRLPRTFNKKSKYGKGGKEVKLLEHNKVRYNLFDLYEKIRFWEDGGYEGIFESVLDNMDIETSGEEEEFKFVYVDFEDDFFNGPVQEVNPAKWNYLIPKVSEPKKKIEPKEEPKKICAAPDEKVNNSNRKPKATNLNVVDEINRYHYKGVRVNYEHLKTIEKDYQNRDMLFYILNRNGYVVGLRNKLIFFFAYNYFVHQHIRAEEDMLEKIRKLNSYFNPCQDDMEIQSSVRNVLEYLKRSNRHERIRHTIIMNTLHFQEEELHIIQGAYGYNIEEQQIMRKEKQSISKKKRYDKYLKEQNKIRKSEKMEYIRKIFEDEPYMSRKKFMELTSLPSGQYDRYREKLGITESNEHKTKRIEEEYFKIFRDNPNIRYKEFCKIKNCSRETFRQWRLKYLESFNKNS